MAKSKKRLSTRFDIQDVPELVQISENCSAAIRKDRAFWIGWIDQIPGVNSQGSSRAELIKNLKSALKEALELNSKSGS